MSKYGLKDVAVQFQPASWSYCITKLYLNSTNWNWICSQLNRSQSETEFCFMKLNPFALKLYPSSYQDFQLSIYSHSAAKIQFHLRLIEHRSPEILFTSAKILLHPVFLDIPRRGVHTVYRTSFTSQSHMTLLSQCNKGSNHLGNQTHLKNLLQQSISIYLFIPTSAI